MALFRRKWRVVVRRYGEHFIQVGMQRGFSGFVMSAELGPHTSKFDFDLARAVQEAEQKVNMLNAMSRRGVHYA